MEDKDPHANTIKTSKLHLSVSNYIKIVTLLTEKNNQKTNIFFKGFFPNHSYKEMLNRSGEDLESKYLHFWLTAANPSKNTKILLS